MNIIQGRSRSKYQMYQRLYEALPELKRKGAEVGRQLGLNRSEAEFGLYPGSSSNPGAVPNYVLRDVVAANSGKIQPVQYYQEELRWLIKSVYGEGYEGLVLNTCESVMRAVNEVLFAAPTMRKGEAYRTRVLTSFNEDFEYLGAYGRPFPPLYKGLASDRSVAAGELSVEGKSLVNLDTLFVKPVGARYEVHGIRPQLVPFLEDVDVKASEEKFRRVAELHGIYLSGFQSIGYDTPGYGHQEHNAQGAPRLVESISNIAHEFDLPHFIDCGGGLPILGYSPEAADADLMSWSMDKAGRSMACGLLVGREDIMLPIRKAAGVVGQRYGGTSSHGKALLAFADPGRDTLVSLLSYLKTLQNQPAIVTGPIDEFHDIVLEAFAEFKFTQFRSGIRITKSYAWGGTEINYRQTWVDNTLGIPISSLEDYFADTNPIPLACEAMGVSSATIYSGNMFVTPGLGTLDENGALIKDRARIAARALVRAIELVCEAAQL